MNKYKFSFILTLLFFFSTTLSAHGPSRQKVSEKIQINAESSKVWSIVKNFKDFKWNSEITECSASKILLDLKELLNSQTEVKLNKNLKS